MPRIFDNIEQHLLPILRETLSGSEQADFCVGYFNLRGWRQISDWIDKLAGGEGACCRLLIGIPTPPEDEVRSAYALLPSDKRIDNKTAEKLKKQILSAFRQQLVIGAPTDEDEAGLRQLSAQLKAKKVILRLFLPDPIHAKFYLVHRHDPNNPTVGFLGSSNLTLSGLTKQVEASVDVLELDACQRLQKLFNDHWNDHWCVDISNDLAELINESWARARPILPYQIYLKIAYHLSSEALAGVSDFPIPREFENRLFDFQKAAVQIAARHLNKQGGVLVGDVVGLGKTLVGTALVRIFEDDYEISTLIICPKNLAKMWQSYVDQYRLRAKVVPLSKIIQELPDIPTRRFQLVLIDESHNLRNSEGKRDRAIQEYIAKSEGKCKCILLSATPYNKTYRDL